MLQLSCFPKFTVQHIFMIRRAKFLVISLSLLRAETRPEPGGKSGVQIKNEKVVEGFRVSYVT